MPGSAAATSGSTDIEFLAADGATWISVMFARARVAGQDGISVPVDGRPLTLQEAIAAAASDAPLSEWLEAIIKEDWSGGFGVDYSAAPGVDTFSSPGYALPGGAATGVPMPGATDSASPIVAFADFGGAFWIAQRGTASANTARVCYMAGGTANPADAFTLGAGQYLRDLVVADDGAGAKVLWASSSDINGANGRMHKCVDAAAPTVWVHYAVYGTNGRNRMKVVHWVDEEGIGATRIFTISSNQGHVSYLKPYADPGLALSWVEGVRTGASMAQPELAAARGHVWVAASDGLYDLDEQGDSPNLTSYSENHVGGGTAAEYLDGYAYYSAGASLDRVRVEQNGVLQENPGTCSPGYLTKTKSPWAVGYTTALKAWHGGMLAAQYCPGLNASGVFWGKDRQTFQNEAGGAVDTVNPLVWHGPFAHTSAAEIVTRMHVTSVPVLPTVSRLYLAGWSTSQLANPTLTWISLPAIGGAVSGLVAGSDHRFATGTAGATNWQPFARIESLADTVGDKGSTKHAYIETYGTQGLPASSPGGTDPSLTVYTRADPLPSSTSWGTGKTVTLGPTADITPAVTSGHSMENRIDLFSPNGAATPPKPAIVDSVRRTYFRSAPSFDAWTINVEYGNGVPNIHNGDMMTDGRSVQWYTDRLLELCASDRTTMRNREDGRYTVKFRQVLPREVDYTEGKAVVATVVVAKLAGPL